MRSHHDELPAPNSATPKIALGIGIHQELAVRALLEEVRHVVARVERIDPVRRGPDEGVVVVALRQVVVGQVDERRAALDVFSEWKSIYVDFSGRLQRAQIDTESL